VKVPIWHILVMFHSRLPPAESAPPVCERSEDPPQIDAPTPVQARPKRLADHRRGECIWPLGPIEATGDWRTLFCCAPVDGPDFKSRRYCAEHAARAFLSTSEEPLP
jgi:hypothetical protein